MRARRQIGGRGGDGREGGELSMLAAPQPSSAPEDGSGGGAGHRKKQRHHAFRRKGPKSAQNLARRLRDGRRLRPDEELMLQITARLATHVFNASLTLYEQGETRQDGEPRVLLTRLLELEKAIRENLAAIFPEEQDDPLQALMRGR